MNEYSAHVGLDVHKETIAVAVALPGREEPVYRGEIKNQRKSVLKLIKRLSSNSEVLSFCYDRHLQFKPIQAIFLDTITAFCKLRALIFWQLSNKYS